MSKLRNHVTLKELLTVLLKYLKGSDFTENFTDYLTGININDASVNLGKHQGVTAQLKEMIPWLLAVHCFNP